MALHEGQYTCPSYAYTQAIGHHLNSIRLTQTEPNAKGSPSAMCQALFVLGVSSDIWLQHQLIGYLLGDQWSRRRDVTGDHYSHAATVVCYAGDVM